MNTTKRSFLTSIMALVLCLTMFLGTTFAWFTDVVTSSGNIIEAGTLDLDLMKGTKTDSGWNWESTEGKAIFDYDKWEPGYTASAVLAVENHGKLSAKWTAKLTLNGTPSILADVITIYVTSYHNYDTTRPDFSDTNVWTKLGTVSEVLNNDGTLLPGGVIDPGHRQPILVALHMDESAGNEYQEKSLGANFDITILATQATAESDSFGPDYDADAQWPELDSGYAASTPIDANNLMLGALTSEVTIGGANGIGATVPADVMIADGASSLDLTMKKVDTDGNLKLGDGDSATSFDVHIEGIADGNTVPMIVNLGAVLPTGLLDTELKLYHTENGVPEQMTKVNSAADFALHNQYTYDPATGNVSIYVASFSVFSSVQTTADEWDGSFDTTWYNENDTEFTLTTAEQLAGFRAIVDGGYYTVANGVWTWNETAQDTFKGKTVKLGADIDLADKPFDPIGFGYWNESKVDAESGVDSNTVFMGTFDGARYTIYNLYQNCWELDPDKSSYSTYTYSTAGAGLFASIKNATIKNLAVSGAEIVFECVDMGIVVGYAQGTCHFENIVVTDSNIANYNRYTGGVVGEVSYGPYGTDTSLGYSHTFKNITVDSTVTVSGLWGSFGCGMGGVIGGKWGDATVKMENVISAPVMDVYNDVVSAYQWYAFRGCGMLIGHTEEPYSDGRHSDNATASFLTCENVEVYYGDWVNYTYYQFAKQTDAQGNRLWYSDYPWVRVEEGKYCDAFSNIRYGIPQVNGVKVTELDEAAFNEAVTDRVEISFNQLYGADRGMYGTASHPGVTVGKISDIATTTVKFQNIEGWDNVKIEYLFAHGEDTWSTLIDGLDATAIENDGTFNIHTFNIPSIAYSFKITGTKNGVDVSTNEFKLTDLKDNEIYSLNGTTLVETTKIVFAPNTAWINGGGRYAVYAFNDSNNIWYNLKSNGTKFVCYLPVNYNKVIFCRMNSAYNINEWNTETDKYVWSQTGNNSIPNSDIDDGEYSYTVGDYLYFKPTEGWKADGARFAAYFFGNGETWLSLTDSDGDGIYEVKVPSGYTKVIFCRMNSAYNINEWNTETDKYVWNQTGDLTFSINSFELFYAVPEDNQWNKPTTGWYGL